MPYFKTIAMHRPRDKNETQGFHNSLILALSCILITGCALFVTKPPTLNWTDHNFAPVIVTAAPFQVFTAQKITAPGQDAVIYIEGDGHAWVTRSQQSTDPTPVTQLVSAMALGDTHPNVIYLARPCQYVGTFDAPCTNAYWGQKRFAPEIIASMNKAIDQIKLRSNAKHIQLIGYSGGGAVAALITAQRHDVSSLITIAGNLDTDFHSKLHDVSSLNGSLNPKTIAAEISAVPQIHYVGEDDDNIPIAIAESFVSAMPENNHATIKKIPHVTHNDGWDFLKFSNPN